jgi:hypothetical protein
MKSGGNELPQRVAGAFGRFVPTMALAAAASACGAQDVEAPSCDDLENRFATEVVQVDYGSGQNFGRAAMPDIALGPPAGAGCCGGSLDVVSLGNGGEIVLGFGANAIVDGPGVDFVVFENPFESDGKVFTELASVMVSEDGRTWHAFPCEATEAPFDQCAGQRPVYLSDDDGPIDPDTSGGDGFDLADLGIARARYVRIVDRPDLQGANGVFDLDAVGIVHEHCR